MKLIQTIVVRLLLLFYLSSSYLSATHIHKDTIGTNSHCKVCIIVKNLNSGDLPNTQIDNLSCSYNYEPIIFEIQKTIKNILKGFNSNAPPLS
ncbi:hypothetical protein MNB_SV-12-931 [hydrothermal vent metagenome]|uniref:Uncharacterized protein n=1 Tax=hydrothermal vent metagenome TaxID=652676 RepID=A0A1W1C9H2_9ZZZZ